MRVSKLQSSFVRGAISPNLRGRSELNTYLHAAARVENAYVESQGGVKRREGLALVDTTTAQQKCRKISFEFNTEQVYLMVFTPAEMKVYRNRVLVATVIGGALAPLTATVLETLEWTQSADTLLLFHPDIQPLKITRSSHTAWTAVALSLSNIPDYNYGTGNEDVISATRGWPATGTFKYGRLWLGGLKSRPSTLLGSKVGDFFNFLVGTADDDAINVTLDDNGVNAIRHLFPGRSLQIFTTGGEFAMGSGISGDPITPTNVSDVLKKATLHGTGYARPLSADGQTIFVEDSGAVVRQFLYNDVEQSYKAPNISQFAPHYVRNPKRTDVRSATANYPADYVYLVNEDGTVSVLNVQRDEDLIAWSLFTTDGYFEDVAVVGDDVFFTVLRQVQGSWMRFIECLDASYKTDCAVKGQTPTVPVGLLLALTTNTKATEWQGFGHLNGKTLSVIGDDYILDDAVPVDGAITTSLAVRDVEVGLPFYALIETLPANLVIAGQSLDGEYKRLVAIGLNLLNSRGVVVQQMTGDNPTWTAAWRQFGTGVLNVPVSLFTGWKKIFLGGFSREARLLITQEAPLEFHVLSTQLHLGVM